MTQATAELRADGPPGVRRAAHARVGEVAARVLFAASGVFVVLATLAMLAFLARAGVRGVMSVGLRQLVTGLVWKPEADAYGGLPLIVGTLVSACGAAFVGALPAVLAAVFVSELAPKRVKPLYRRVMELAAAVPSVVYGWLALTFLVPVMERVAHAVYGESAVVTGEGLAASAVLLAVMIGPTVCLLALDALSRVPPSLYDASAALGASRLQTAFRVSLPTAWRGLVVAVFFGFARAAGETMAVQMVIGGARKLPTSLFSPTTTISTQIVMDMQNARPDTTSSDVLFSMALVLLVISTGVVLFTRNLGRRRSA
jgi:phosphate transport system permease protein